MKSHNVGTDIGILDVILIVNIILKLLKLINWSWWLVLWPLWFGMIYFIILLIIIIFFYK